MSRGFDGFEIDDLRDSQWQSEPSSHSRESSRGRGNSSQPEAGVKIKLAKIRETEYQSDHLDSQSRERQEANPPSLSRDTRQADLLAQRERTGISNRDRSYSLRPSEIRTLTEVGKFRVVAVEDIAKQAYAGDRSRMDSDLRNLIYQRLVERRDTSVLKKESQQVLTLTKQGKRLIRRHGFVLDDQAIYSGFVKPKEADHDAALYRLYHKAADEIERKGGKVLGVQLDYELKEKLYRKLGQAQWQGEGQTHGRKEALAREMHLPVVHGKVSFPDLRIEYANQEMEISRVDVELATGHYHAGHLAEKARAGFQIYARSEDADGLRRVRDDREIMTAILSL
jgi:DNA-binding MarR family transcriptional regulator